jgi:SAM-dependent methyltransferase
MRLVDLVRRRAVPEPWSEGEKIPWHEPEFSRRMLDEHLSQAHDAASRRRETIGRHVAWIHGAVLSKRATRILDLGCGPGLYASRLAKRGHECVGIDCGPASIAYAREEAERERLRCTYRKEDIRSVEYGDGFGLVMLIFGELNAFPPADAREVLERAHAALEPGGRLLLEPHTFAAVRRVGERAPSWRAAERGLFSARPHVWLRESFWDAERRAATERWYVIDAETGEVTRHAASAQAYTDEEYRSLLAECGFGALETYPSLTGEEDPSQRGLFALVAERGGPARGVSSRGGGAPPPRRARPDR